MKKIYSLLFIIAIIFSLAACGEVNITPAPNEEETTNPQVAATTPYEQATTTIQPDTTTLPQKQNDNNIRPEFKEAMDSYEAFYDEYCDFMLKYKENPGDFTLLSEYLDMISQLTEMEAAFSSWAYEDLSNEELAYYLEVTSRVAEKLLKIS